MASGSVDIKMEIDVSEVLREISITQERLQTMRRPAMQAALGQLHRHAASIVPVDTGRLKNSIFPQVQGGGESGFVGTNLYYAPYVEFGTSKMRARRFFGRTVRSQGQAAINTYRSILLGR